MTEPDLSSDPNKAANEKPELVTLIVSALGTDVAGVLAELEVALRSVSYRPEQVRVSDLLRRNPAEFGAKEREPEQSEPEWLMSLGDQLRLSWERTDAAALMAMIEMRRMREVAVGGDDGSALPERAGVATILLSAKRPEEIKTLRLVYGSRLFVIGVSSPERDRRKYLLRRLAEQGYGESNADQVAEAERLLSRDEADEDNLAWGQSLRKAFAKSDAFVRLRHGSPASGAVQRLVDLWFGKAFETPSRDEQAMFHAYASRFRSAATGRQVGAVVVDAEGEVLVTGTNDVPKPGGGQYWSGDEPDHRDFKLRYETNDVGKRGVLRDVLDRLALSGWLSQERSATPSAERADAAISEGGPLEGSKITDLLEFGRIMHAEMAAICTAARRGTAIGRGVLYTTTYPCHECARLIIGAGITRVVYIDPYPKSQVELMYEHLIAEAPDADSPDRVTFMPFEGIGPALFPRVFQMRQRGRDLRGAFEAWKPSPLAVWGPDVPPGIELEALALNELARVAVDGDDTASDDGSASMSPAQT
ncbi:deaminase [Agrococcus sp. DT81.2]|uniref:deaminase n=1 Tax=Agrococcus sp. DT81.2 TaxID=3393414 RepID=UPI003CE5629E